MSIFATRHDRLLSWEWIGDHTDEIWERTLQHLQLTGYAVGIGLVIAMAMSMVALRWRRAYAPLAALSGALYSIPSLALFAILVPYTGLGFRPVLIALVTYTLLILLRNIVAGIDGVPRSVLEAADGMGYEPWRRFLAVDLRLATPAIIGGIRVATVTVIGLVTVGALVGSGGYGVFINDGLSRNFTTPIIVGGGLSIAMAIAFDLLFVAVQRLTTPWSRAGMAP
ncbi:ABC transporter permease [Acidimicrobiia bacterium EGI L10123]|uniref:ABC transporter permease n=1 Tax=Salinilacustrithrix flava TaxID=2957203 RepID=UPI003D7C2B98|nr:ABC transporter permease [Acidimicrobiia bacterium EGI L10123]